jgi:type II secretion system protein H
MRFARSNNRGFTLIEIMIVIAIMGIVLVIGIPAISSALHREALQQGVWDVMTACRDARAKAIMSGTPMELRFLSGEGRFEIGPAAVDATPGSTEVAPASPAPAPEVASSQSSSWQFSDSIAIKMLEINFVSYMDSDRALVRFYPNGTSDEFTLVLVSDRGEQRMITLEVVTALADTKPL